MRGRGEGRRKRGGQRIEQKEGIGRKEDRVAGLSLSLRGGWQEARLLLPAKWLHDLDAGASRC